MQRPRGKPPLPCLIVMIAIWAAMLALCGFGFLAVRSFFKAANQITHDTIQEVEVDENSPESIYLRKAQAIAVEIELDAKPCGDLLDGLNNHSISFHDANWRSMAQKAVKESHHIQREVSLIKSVPLSCQKVHANLRNMAKEFGLEAEGCWKAAQKKDRTLLRSPYLHYYKLKTVTVLFNEARDNL